MARQAQTRRTGREQERGWLPVQLHPHIHSAKHHVQQLFAARGQPALLAARAACSAATADAASHTHNIRHTIRLTRQIHPQHTWDRRWQR